MGRQLRNSLLIFAVVLASAAAAYVIADEAAGTIRSVDAKSRTVVLRVDQQKALDLTVSRKAKVLVDGKESTIEAIRSGQKATVIYSADTEVATEVRATSDPNSGDEGVADMKWLQGEWVAVKKISGKDEISKAVLRSENDRLKIVGNKMTRTRIREGNLDAYEGRFELSGNTSPKQFDWLGKGSNGAAMEWEGVYEVDRDLNEFTFLYVFKNAKSKRPDSLDNRTGTYLKYKRVVD